MKTTILAIVAVLVLSIGSYSQQWSGKSTDNSLNPGINSQDNIVIYQLLSFTVSSSFAGNQWTTHLAWTAEGETQITGYEIERKMSTNLKVWNVIASVPGSHSNAPITRKFAETFTLYNSLTVFYRLKIYFVNGSVQYSPVVYVTIGAPSIVPSSGNIEN